MKAVHLFAIALVVCAIASGCDRSPVGVDVPALTDTVRIAGAVPANPLTGGFVTPVHPDRVGVHPDLAAWGRFRNYAVAW